MNMILDNKKILIIGGTGSLGKTLVHRILSSELGKPSKIIVMSRDEAKQHEMRMSYQHRLVATDEVIYRNFMDVLEFRIGDIRNYADVCVAVKDADIVVNVAALKQVPVCEYFPTQAIMTNCLGAANIVRAIEENDYVVNTVLAISTDKACKPVNVMGMTKSIQERIITSANITNPKTRFVCVRYGNVLASRGSVIPLFHHQIQKGGPITVTNPEMTRFLLSLNQAVDTIFEALRNANRGETYVPNASSTTVMNIARALIGDRKIDIKTIGIRPGEKLHEILISEEEARHCVTNGNYYVILPMLPELRDNKIISSSVLSKELSSADKPLDLVATVKLLNDNQLMVDEASFKNTELLR
jgi:UDP-glucose 4-epimerase